ncbi:MAG: O-antigen ligase family protein [Bacteroidales bacterium]|nr:O-antigen ligase family protein [Bacteroidales bacterium]
MFISKYREKIGPLSESIAIFTMFGASIVYCAFSKTKVIWNGLARSFNVQMIELYLITLFFASVVPLPARIQYFAILLPLLLFFFSYKITKDIDGILVYLIGISVVVVALVLFFFTNYYNNELYDTEEANNAAYTVLVFLPFLLCYRRVVVRIASIVLVFVITLLSLKRGGLFGVSLGMAIYLFIDQVAIKEKKINMAGLLVILVGLVGLYLLFDRFNETSGGLFMTRLEEMSETGGSNRILIYEDKLHEIVNSDFLGLIFGHGWLATENAGKIKLTAHNDILEIAYDFGLVGLCLFACVIMSLYRLQKDLIDEKSRLAAPFGASMGILLVLIGVSHIWVYHQMLSVFALFWGFVLAAKGNEYFRRK